MISIWSGIGGIILPVTPVVEIIKTFSSPNCRNYWRNFCLKAPLVKRPKKYKRWSSLNLTEDVKLMAAGPLKDWLVFLQQTLHAMLGKRERTLSSSKTHKNYVFHLESKEDWEKVRIQMRVIRGKPLGDKEANRSDCGAEFCCWHLYSFAVLCTFQKPEHLESLHHVCIYR